MILIMAAGVGMGGGGGVVTPVVPGGDVRKKIVHIKGPIVVTP